MSRTLINPAVMKYLATVGRAVDALAENPALDELRRNASTIGELYTKLASAERMLESTLPGDNPEAIRGALAELRRLVDRLEKLVDDELWPLPKYRELLFIY